MIQADGTIRTDDMAFAAVLACHGLNPSLEAQKKGRKKIGIWVVTSDEVTAVVRELTEQYISGKARVEPRRFMREVRAIRQELYKFLDHADAERGQRIVPEA